MGALEHFLTHGIRLELEAGDNVRAIGSLNESLRTAIRAQKPQIVGELQWREFEVLLAVIGPAYRTPAHEYADMREAARRDLPAALTCYRSLLAQLTAGR